MMHWKTRRTLERKCANKEKLLRNMGDFNGHNEVRTELQREISQLKHRLATARQPQESPKQQPQESPKQQPQDFDQTGKHSWGCGRRGMADKHLWCGR